MSAGEHQLTRIAEALADGRPVDWAAETSSDPEVLQRARNLRLIERIRDAHLGDANVPANWGTLEIRGRIGGGAYSEVYRAWDPALQTHVALKLLHVDRQPESPDALLAEARHLARIRHPNVVTVHGAAVNEGRVGIWAELIEGQTLEQDLQDRGPYRAEEAALIALDLVRALAAVHGQGLVHRDVKTSNVMREAGGRIVLTDFGSVVDSARLLARPEESLVGTAHYMAPEALRGEGGGKSADIYALGVVLYRLVTGRYPMDARSLPELLEQHRRGAARSLREARPELSAAFVRIVERATAPDPALRYRDVREMERDLVQILGREVPRPAVPRRWMLRAALGVVVLAAGWFAWTRGALGPLDVRCDLFRSAGGSTERLAPGKSVAVGDQLFLELESTRDAWVYVFNEDEDGNAYLLFPLKTLEVANPLRSGKRWRLPGVRDGVALTWDVTTAGGRETLYVIASTDRLGELEGALADVPEAGMAKPVSMEILRRGMGGLGVMPAQPEARPRIADLFSRLVSAADESGGMWTWFIQLENARP
jgi:hypothetical protein